MNISIIGAGVIGLSVGIKLLETFPKISVTIICDKQTPDTTSDIAAGLWFPYAIGENVNEIKRWCAVTHKFLINILKKDSNHHKYGIFLQEYYGLSDKDTMAISFVHKIFWNSRLLNDRELETFGSPKYGFAATTIMSQGSKLMSYLTDRFTSNGGIILEGHVDSFDKFQSQGNYPIIINCSGLGAKALCNDCELHPLRGQIIKVYAPWVKFAITLGSAYILPQSDGTVVLGGTAQKDNYDINPSERDTVDILNKCFKLLPGLKESKILNVKVGLRPYRSTVRLEVENKINSLTGRSYTIVHNYGHGGAGLTMFWGCANDVAELVKDSMIQPKI